MTDQRFSDDDKPVRKTVSPHCIAHGCDLHGTRSDATKDGPWLCRYHHPLPSELWGRQTMLIRKHWRLLVFEAWVARLAPVELKTLIEQGGEVAGYPALAMTGADWRTYGDKVRAFVWRTVALDVGRDRLTSKTEQVTVNVPQHVTAFVRASG